VHVGPEPIEQRVFRDRFTRMSREKGQDLDETRRQVERLAVAQ
jgi:hypothetical protein